MGERSANNCGFYPACYIAGDCPQHGWQTGNCGLPKDEQASLRNAFWADLRLRSARHTLGKQLAAAAARGEYDHMLEEKSDGR